MCHWKGLIMKKIWLVPVALVLLVIALDMITKGVLLHLITGGIPVAGGAFDLIPFPYMMTRVTDFFNIVFTWNPGTSFSLFQGLGESMPLVLIFLTGVIIGFLCWQLFARKNERFERIALALIIGGALGNLIDRIRFGAVIDFLDFHAMGWHWPAFNVADIAICVGVAVYVIGWVFRKK
jgi:signal peptidase II